MNTRKLYGRELERKYGRMTFGRFLISWRTSEELSQADFARKLGLSAANLCDLEQERRIPSPSRAKKIARKLGLPEKGLIVLALQDDLRSEGLKFSVVLEEAA